MIDSARIAAVPRLILRRRYRNITASPDVMRCAQQRGHHDAIIPPSKP